jgi:hypothetical protein
MKTPSLSPSLRKLAENKTTKQREKKIQKLEISTAKIINSHTFKLHTIWRI